MNESLELYGTLDVAGTRGYSAYEIAQQQGYTGTEEEWLESLVGPEGPEGPEGQQGPIGPTGLTPAFRIGNVTTVNPGGDATATITGTPEVPILNLGLPKGATGEQGIQGIQGIQGEQGIQGIQGVSIVDITKKSTVGLVDTYEIELSDGQKPTFTVTNGEDGIDGEVTNEQLNRVKSIANALPKVEGEGSDITLEDTANNAPLELLLEGNTSQDGTPTPETPVSIKVVTGEQNINIQNKNLCDLSQGYRRGYINANGGAFKAENVSYVLNQYIEVIGGNTYTYSTNQSITNMAVYSYNENKEFIKREKLVYSKKVCTVTVDSNAKYILLGGNYNNYNMITQAILNGLDIQLENGSIATTYTPYQLQTYPLSLGTIELARINDYKDYIFKNEVDSPYYNANLDLNGWHYSNLFTKINSYNEETITTPYISTTGGLDVGATIYYYDSSNAPIKITDTTLISQLENINNNAHSYKDTTIIKCTSESTDNETFLVPASAYLDLNTLVDRISNLETVA